MAKNDSDEPGRVSRAWNSRPTMIGAVVVIAIVVLVVGAAIITTVVSPKGSHRVATATTSPSKIAGSGTNGCSVEVDSTSTTPAVPKDLSWKTGIDGLSWPVSKSVGPTKTIGGFDACFARSPLGASLAAVTATYSQYDPKHTVQSALGYYIADSAGKAANIAGTAKNFDPATVRSSGLNPAGFIVDSFTRSQAQITLVDSYAPSATGYVGIPCTMTWAGGDWKLSVLDNGELSSGNATTPSKDDFIAWGGADQ